MSVGAAGPGAPEIDPCTQLSRYTGGEMNSLPASAVPGKTETERIDNAVRKEFTVPKEEIQRREAEQQKTNGKKAGAK
jgi:hypothetical protein